MRWFAMIATYLCVVAGIHGGLTHAAEPVVRSGFNPVAAAARPRVSAAGHRLQMVAQTETTPSPVTREAAVSSAEDYRYRPDGRRDPFESLVKEKAPVVELSRLQDPDRPRGPLERFDISALKLVGILWGELGRRALIRAPDDKGYFVTVGTYMGENGGQVMAIHDDRLMIEEKYKDSEGKIVGKSLTLPLRRKEAQDR